MTNFQLFTDAHLSAAEARRAENFDGSARLGFLASAEVAHRGLLEVRAEIARRAAMTEAA